MLIFLPKIVGLKSRMYIIPEIFLEADEIIHAFVRSLSITSRNCDKILEASNKYCETTALTLIFCSGDEMDMGYSRSI